jgi:hypothetical protein
MPKTRRLTTILLPALALSVSLIAAPAAQAADTSPTVSPTSVSEGDSPAMTFTWTVTNPGPGRVIGVGLEAYSMAGDEVTTAVLAGSTVTCTFPSGAVATWRSTGFSAGAGGAPLCDIYLWNDGYIYLELTLGGNVALSAGTVSLEVSAGVLEAPATPGSYTFTGYVWNGNAYLDYGAGSITVGNVGNGATPVDEPRAWTVLRQGVPLPDSGDCADVVDEHLGWGTAVAGGWQRAWEPWAGQSGSGGGWACIRAIVNKAGHHWSVDNSVL